MFAPKVAKPQTKAAEVPTSRLATGHRGYDPVEQALFLQRSIGNQATLRLLAQRASRAEQEVAPENTTAREAPDRVADQVLRMPGEPLDPGFRGEAERRFGHDGGNVRVHSGPEASKAAAAVGAPAFTLGRHIVAQHGASDPATPEGRAIFSHELTHVVQQASFDDCDLGGAPVLDAAHPSEQEARAGTGAATPLASPAIQRAPLDLLKSGQQFLVDLTKSSWRQTLDFAGGQTQVVYVLRDTTTGELLKVGKTSVAEVLIGSAST